MPEPHDADRPLIEFERGDDGRYAAPPRPAILAGVRPWEVAAFALGVLALTATLVQGVISILSFAG